MSAVSSLIATLTSPAGLRRVLWADAASGTAMAALHLAAPERLSQLLGLPVALLTESAWLLLPFVLLAGWLALQRPPARGALALLAIGNFVWVAASVLLLAAAPLAPTALGVTYVVVQAAAVLVLAELQWRARGRLSVTVPATR